MQSGDVGVGLALPGVPPGECGTRGRQAVPLRLAQLDHDVGAGLVPALPVGKADCRAPTRDAPTPRAKCLPRNGSTPRLLILTTITPSISLRPREAPSKCSAYI